MFIPLPPTIPSNSQVSSIQVDKSIICKDITVTGDIHVKNSDTQVIYVDTGILTGSNDLTIVKTYLQGSKLVATDYTGITPNQGHSVSISADGNTLAIGAFGADSTGATWIFNNINGIWTQTDKLVGTGSIGNSFQGSSVSLSANGMVLAIGGPTDDDNIGATWIFKNISGTWTQITKIVYTDIRGGYQGQSVSLNSDGTILAICSRIEIGNKGKGILSSRIFKNIFGNSWTQTAILIPNDAINPISGGSTSSLSLNANGTILAMGDGGDNSNIGATWIFKNLNGSWSQVTKLVGTNYIDTPMQGKSVSLSSDGNILAVGGPSDNNYIGATWIFKNMNGIWSQITKLVATNNIDNPQQGISVSLSSNGTILAVGGPNNDSGIGATWIFKNIGDTWTQISSLIANNNIGDPNQGFSVSLSATGYVLAIGGIGDDGNIGATWIFNNENLLISKNLLVGSSVTSSVGFFGTNPVQQQVAIADVNSILDLLKAYGLSG
jgi:hypothetical protein